jgi:formylmethanofuran dehydrogenase subunit A
MSDYLRINNGFLHDPANGVDGLVRDLFIADGKVVNALTDEQARAARTLDATGCVVMPGGVDIHCHIASSAANRARALRGEEHATHVHHADPARGLRSGSGNLTPSTFTTGQRYAALGYTTALEAAVSPSGARQTHLELSDTPNLDAGFLLLLGNHQHLIELLAAHNEAGAVAFASTLLRQTGALGMKIVNPGGVASWRSDASHSLITSLDDTVASTSVTPRKILCALATAAETLRLPHAPHIHCNRLGVPGNVAITLDTLRALQGRRAHLTHLQFHAYGSNDQGELVSGASELVQFINAQPMISADVGQVIFGQAFTLTADTPLEHALWKLTGKPTQPYFSIENELETGCGSMPITYSDKHATHSVQWAIGLELMLMASDPWRMLLSTDHPNGGSFLAYPRVIASLMSQSHRNEQLQKAHPAAKNRTSLASLTREFTLNEIAIVTRAGPARALGLTQKGHLGQGADADVTIYNRNLSDPQTMFESPRWVIKAGQIVVDDGQLRTSVRGQHFKAPITPHERGNHELRRWFDTSGSYSVKQFGLHEHELSALRNADPHVG